MAEGVRQAHLDRMMTTTLRRALLPAALLAASGGAATAQIQTATINGVTIPYVVQGAGPPLVLIHGWAVNLHFWDGLADSLASHYTVIRYDRRGFGDAAGGADPTADPADLAELLRQLGFSRAHVMGHSAGVGTALTFAVRYPDMVAGLVLYGAGPIAGEMPQGKDVPPIAEWIAAGRTYGVDSLHAAIGRWSATSFGGSLSPAQVERAGQLLASYSGQDLLAPVPPSNLVAPIGPDDIRSIGAPTLIVVGADDMGFIRTASDDYASRIPDAELVVIPGGGHVVSWQQPGRFTAAVLSFLQLVDSRP